MTRILFAGLLFAMLLPASLTLAQMSPVEQHDAASLERLLQVPTVNYRRDWVLLGSYALRADNPEDGSKDLHVVYAPGPAVDAYLKTGTFPDGTVLVKDVFAAKTEALTTGTASYADTLKGRFVMVKDSTNQNAKSSPLWGDGWGWSFFEGDETAKTVTTDYRKDCLGCHEPAHSQDLLYTQGYPILRR
ncbi:cytochrome P460 family protein [Methyloceanibacter sp.]|uniref:cytochrome P460 family protein n=1 Tax=Methyloceanibacter sp. TaxID=1965321 RepID=UPI0025CE8D93|nr:cytochrome P460 family protein [Methyloceanibacter sp.]